MALAHMVLNLGDMQAAPTEKKVLLLNWKYIALTYQAIHEFWTFKATYL